jgi:hypothetical protein
VVATIVAIEVHLTQVAIEHKGVVVVAIIEPTILEMS